MEFGGRYRFAARRDDVWAALNDAAVLKAVIPGCESIHWTGPHSLDLKIKVSLGVVHPVFSGELTLSNVIPARSYTLSGRGKGGILGMAGAAADIHLDDADAATILRFNAAGKADGGIMRLGRALIGQSAQAVIDGFFERIGAQMNVAVVALDPASA